MALFDFTSWLRKAFPHSRRTNKRIARKEKTQALTLERLEDRITPSGIVTVLASLSTSGKYPDGGVVEDASGNLFGTTYDGGASGDGTVFEVAKGSGAATVLATFNGANGANPSGDLVEDASGNLFGTTIYGGASGDGTVFEVAKGSGTVTDLATFTGTGTEYPDGANPQGGLVEDASGNLFGTTSGGGANDSGAVFEVTGIGAGTVSLTALASFNGTDGGHPLGSLIEDSSGNLFGTTIYGGASGDGTVFEVAQGSGAVTDLAAFAGADGANPDGGVVQDSSGNLFGATENGGASGDGTVFEVAQGSGAVTVLASFNPADGGSPAGGLVEDASGNFFGTTYGDYGYGTVFEVGPDTWTGEGSNNLWSNPDNWSGDTVPAAGDDLVFPSGALQETSVNDLGLTFSSITTADTYSFSGQPLTTNSLDVQQGSLELDSPTTVTGTLSVEANATMTIGAGANLEIMSNASLDDEGNLTIAANATLTDDNSVTVASNAYLDDEGTLTVAPNASLTETGSPGQSPNLTFTAPNVATPPKVQLNNGNYGFPDTLQLWSVNTNLVNEVLTTPQGYTNANGWYTGGTTVSLANNATFNVASGPITNGPSLAGYLLQSSGGNPSTNNKLDEQMHVTLNIGATMAPTATAGQTVTQHWLQLLNEDQPYPTKNGPYGFMIKGQQGYWQIDNGDLTGTGAGSSGSSPSPFYDVGGVGNAAEIGDDPTVVSDGMAGAYLHFYDIPVWDVQSANSDTIYLGDSGFTWGFTVKPAVGINIGATGAISDSGGVSVGVNTSLVDHGNLSILATGTLTISGSVEIAVGATLNDQGSIIVAASGTLSDQDSITVAVGGTLDVFGNLTEGAGGAQKVFGTLVIEPAATLDLIGSVMIEPGATYSPLGTVTAALSRCLWYH